MHRHLYKLFFTDNQLFQVHRNEIFYTLIALQQALKANRFFQDNAPEILALCDAVFTYEEKISLQVWSDPFAYCWCLLAYELVKATLTGTSLLPFAQNYCQAIGIPTLEQATIHHLNQLKLFIIASSLLSEQGYRFRTPFIPDLPLAIPGTSLYLESKCTLKIYAVEKGGVEVEVDGSKTSIDLVGKIGSDYSLLKVGRCPIVQYKSCQLRLQPYSFNTSAFPEGQAAVQAGTAYQAEYADVLQDSLGLIEQHQPDTFQQFQEFMQILGIKPLEARGLFGLSSSDFPGSLICAGIKNPYPLADILIHEFYHNRLFLVERNIVIWANSVSPSQSDHRYYSPWRQDLRPLRGIFHGLYVYTPVSYFWLEVYRSGQTKDVLLEFVMSQILLLSLQLQIGQAQLKRYAELTSDGENLLNLLSEQIRHLKEEIMQTQLSYDLPARKLGDDGSFIYRRRKNSEDVFTVKDVIIEHLQRFDRLEQIDVALQHELALKKIPKGFLKEF